MKINAIENEGVKAACIVSDGIVLSGEEDALQLIADCGCQGFRFIIINGENIAPGFFDLRTGIAGEALQKFSTYDSYLAIIGDFSNVTSRALRDFIRESNRQGRIFFTHSVDEAIRLMAERN